MGRFDQSFVIRMIRDFILALTLIVLFELGVQLALSMFQFETRDQETVELAAERLASDVRNIMLNRGGPVAARTVYPIIRRNYARVNLDIAIVPSAVTEESILRSQGFTPRGVPPEWREGDHKEASVALEAEEACLSCHVTARPGDVLGRVHVRKYRSARLGEFAHEARLTGILGMATVIVHTIVLFFLLRTRMEPLLGLRSTVSRLAKGRLDLSRRAEVRTDDEFGELAADLNHFLDRVCFLIEDLEGVLGKVSAANERLATVSGRMEEEVERLQAGTADALGRVVEMEQTATTLSGETLEGLETLLSTLEELSDGGPVTTEVRDRLRAVTGRFRESSGAVREQMARLPELREVLVALAREVQDDSHYIGQVRMLGERLEAVARSGATMLERMEGWPPKERPEMSASEDQSSAAKPRPEADT